MAGAGGGALSWQGDSGRGASGRGERDDETQRGRHCEADFYIGELRLEAGARDAAGRLFKSAVDRCPHQFLEYVAAVAELKKLAP